MARKIESDKLYVKDIFSKWFRIPEYQRPYVWETDQVQELLSDVMDAQSKNPDSDYFLGSMVFCKKEKTDKETSFEECDLLDGQQRVSTLFLIMAVIRDLSENKQLSDTCQGFIYQEENVFDGTPERIRIIFDIREQVRDFVNDYIRNYKSTEKPEITKISEDKNQDISIRNMANAILTIRNFFKENSYSDFLKFLLQKVLLIYVSAGELEDAFRLFTVMNSRGVKLRNSDILKASNLSLITDSKKRINYAEKWEDIENYFGEDFDNFLSHLRTILVKQKATVNLLKEFEDNIYNPKIYDRNTKEYHKTTPLLNKGEDTFNFIIKYKKYYEFLFEEDHKSENGNYELYNRLLIMRKGFEADYWIAPLLRYYDKFKDSSLIDFIKVLDNKFAHDWITGFYPTHRIERVNAIIQAIDDAQTVDDVLYDNSLVLDDIDNLKNNLSGNIYGKRSAKYVMLKLDMLLHGHTSKMEMPDTISIEHIMPQNPDPTSQWCHDFTEEQRSEWCNKLGNLTLISRRKNSSQSNKDYELKKEKYFKGNIETFSNSVRIFQNHPKWKLTDIEQNQGDVIKVLFDSFGI